MNKTICIFDADGTFYDKESPLTFEMRNRVVHLLSDINSWTLEETELKYRNLRSDYPNPYLGVGSIGLSPSMYQSVFNSLSVEAYISKDVALVALMSTLSQYAEIYVLSFAPVEYVNRLLTALGIIEFIASVSCADCKYSYEKGNYYAELKLNNPESMSFIAVGDDFENDIMPALAQNYEAYLVDNHSEQRAICTVISTILQFISSQSSVPSIMRIETSTNCNESCTFCSYSLLRRKHGKMDIMLFNRLIEEHSQIAVNPQLLFPASIGEPFLDELFLEFVKRASKYYNKISAFSNGSLLSEDTVERYIDFGGTELLLTLHGYTADEYVRITRTDYYEVVRKNILESARINNRRGNPLNIILDVYVRNNIEVDEYIEELRQLGVYVNILCIDQTHNWAGKIYNQTPTKRTRSCQRIYKQFGVQYDGSVVPCVVDSDGEYVLGNCYDQSLSEIFTSHQYVALTRCEKCGTLFDIPLCRFCNIY